MKKKIKGGNKKKCKLGIERKYSVENIKTALEMVKKGEVGSLRESAKLHGVIFFVTAKLLQLNQIVSIRETIEMIDEASGSE